MHKVASAAALQSPSHMPARTADASTGRDHSARVSSSSRNAAAAWVCGNGCSAWIRVLNSVTRLSATTDAVRRPSADRGAFGRRTASVVADSRVTEFRTRIHALQPLPQTQAAAAFRELDDTLAEWSRPVLASAVRAGMCDGDCSAAADATLCMYGHLLRAAYQGGRAHWMTYR